MAAVLGEALENIRRHTPESASASIVLAEEPGWVRLVVTDDGPGFAEDSDDARTPGHFGLVGMQERAARVGGRLGVTSRPGIGTTVELWVPGSVSHDDLLRGGLLPTALSEVAP
jgi:signal transduction histidine kinase